MKKLKKDKTITEQSGRNALALAKDKVFGLLVVLTVLLGWLAGVGAGSLMGLENIYTRWQLAQKSQISIYLPADSDSEQVKTLSKELKVLPGVTNVKRLDREQTLALIEPYFEDASAFPLPIVMDITITEGFKRDLFEQRVRYRVVDAQIDDAREMLESVSSAVRGLQSGVGMMAVVIFVVMALIVSLTVRAGLRGQKKSLSILQYIGATDGFVTVLVSRQVLGRSLIGWGGASALVIFTGLLILALWPISANYFDASVWFVAIITPLALLAVAVASAWVTAYRIIRDEPV